MWNWWPHRLPYWNWVSTESRPFRKKYWKCLVGHWQSTGSGEYFGCPLTIHWQLWVSWPIWLCCLWAVHWHGLDNPLIVTDHQWTVHAQGRRRGDFHPSHPQAVHIWSMNNALMVMAILWQSVDCLNNQPSSTGVLQPSMYSHGDDVCSASALSKFISAITNHQWTIIALTGPVTERLDHPKQDSWPSANSPDVPMASVQRYTKCL